MYTNYKKNQTNVMNSIFIIFIYSSPWKQVSKKNISNNNNNNNKR